MVTTVRVSLKQVVVTKLFIEWVESIGSNLYWHVIVHMIIWNYLGKGLDFRLRSNQLFWKLHT